MDRAPLNAIIQSFWNIFKVFIGCSALQAHRLLYGGICIYILTNNIIIVYMLLTLLKICL